MSAEEFKRMFSESQDVEFHELFPGAEMIVLKPIGLGPAKTQPKERAMDEDYEKLVEAIGDFVSENDGEDWRARAAKLRDAADYCGTRDELAELLSWFGGDIDTKLE